MSGSDTDTLAELRRALTPEAAIQAFLHDPPDMALGIPGHLGRAARYLSAILRETVQVEAIKSDSALADQLAAIAERLPMPTAGPDGVRAVGPRDGRLRAHHPLGGPVREEPVPELDEARIIANLADLCSGIDDRNALARLLWRCLPERMAAIHPAYAWLPADTRVPDHTIWHHADTVTAFAAGVGATGKGDHALLCFAISPVQNFIAAARSLRDLRNGSLLLSWLTFRAMRPVLECVGPWALIFPSLRGNAMVDQWLRGAAGGLGSKIIIQPDDAARLLSPSLPNRFLALVPMGPDGTWAAALARAVQAGATAAWTEVAAAVRSRLGRKLNERFPGWDASWDTQIGQTWDAVATVLPLRECTDEALAGYRGRQTFAQAYPQAEQVRGLGAAIPSGERPGYAQSSAGRWQASVELAARMLAAARSVRQVPVPAPVAGDVPEKCTLLGTWERMGPGHRDGSRAFWEHLAAADSIDGARVRKGEALCAVSLVKRFAMGAFLAEELGLERRKGEPRDGRFPDTATLAARRWPGYAELRPSIDDPGWNGQWLHWPKRDFEADDACPEGVWPAIESAKAKERHGPPPTYYAVLVLDGDDMGNWLAGKNSPTVGDALHPKLRAYFDGRPGLAAPRPVAPSLHAAISEALGNFSQAVVPGIVQAHDGELVYAGGDDVLALLPAETALACARALDRAFRGDDPKGNEGAPAGYYRHGDRDLLMMGPRASISAGIAVVHYKEDLRLALRLAREAEAAAKQSGRNRLSLTIARRSGEHASAWIGWDLVGELADAVEVFREASDRWAYRMRALLPVFREGGPPEDAFLAELRRQLARGDDSATRDLKVLDFYQQMRKSPKTEACWQDTAERLIKLWQSASFLARGRDVAGRT
jgi:CRISPR-associated protein Cmr2